MAGIRTVLTLVAGLATVLSTGVANAATSGGWSNVGPRWLSNPTYGPLPGSVYVLERSGSKLYVGGAFDDAGGVPAADRIAVWNGTKWSAVCPGIGSSGAVYSIAVDSQTGRVYAGGSFSNAGGDANADGLAVCDNGSWHALAATAFPSNVIALEIVGRTLYISCGCLNIGGFAAADYVATWGLDGGGFAPITDDSGDFINAPNDIEADGAGGVYMGGNFKDADGIAEADFVVHYDGAGGWSALGAGPGPEFGAIQSQPGQVRGLAVAPNGDVTIVGAFTNVNGTGGAGDKVARWNGASWEALGASSFFGEADAVTLLDVVLDGPRVFVVGSFSNAGGLTKVDGIAGFRNGAWTNVGTDAAGTGGPITGPSPQLKDLEIVGARLYIGGIDQDIGGGVLNDFIASYRLRQPDALIRTTGSFIGNGVYDTKGTDQTRTRTVNQGATATFTIRMTNDGFAAEDVTVRGPGSQAGFAATYLRGTTDITAQVVAGTYTLAGLAPGGSVDLVLKVKVGGGVANGASRSWLVTATSGGSGAPKDAVKARVTTS